MGECLDVGWTIYVWLMFIVVRCSWISELQEWTSLDGMPVQCHVMGGADVPCHGVRLSEWQGVLPLAAFRILFNKVDKSSSIV